MSYCGVFRLMGRHGRRRSPHGWSEGGNTRPTTIKRAAAGPQQDQRDAMAVFALVPTQAGLAA